MYSCRILLINLKLEYRFFFYLSKRKIRNGNYFVTKLNTRIIFDRFKTFYYKMHFTKWINYFQNKIILNKMSLYY